ncbi:MAG: hypothetical protein KBO59_23980 [Achromobacter sp.]|nr:hypothetical protein [Achromobacter sp.]
MARKKKAAQADTLVAASAILIEGKHFDRGQPIEGVSEAELKKAVSIHRVVTASSLKAQAAPEQAPAEPAPDGAGEEDEGEAEQPGEAES